MIEIRRFIARTVEGAQRPPRFEASDGHEYVLKLDTHDPDFPVAELVSAHLGHVLSVTIPPFEVLAVPEPMPEAFDASGDVDLKEFATSFLRLGGLCFGSRWVPGPLQRWTPTLRHVVDGADTFLARLLVFDAFIENGDRQSSTNPNLLASSTGLFAIDHGQALPAIQGIFGKRMPFPHDSHLAWPVVRERPYLLAEPIADLRALPDQAIHDALAAVPDAWWTDRGRESLAFTDICSRRGVVADTLDALRKSLT